MKIGFIGQGYVGKNYADYFEENGHEVVRYSLEPEYKNNKALLKNCEWVFVAVPTPTTPQGFDLSIVEDALKVLKPGTVAIIKSTILPGSTEKLQKLYPDLKVLFSPEFLRENTSRKDVFEPKLTLVGSNDPELALDVISQLPWSPFSRICTPIEAELFKYFQNVNGYFQVMMFNIFFNVVSELNLDWTLFTDIFKADSDFSVKFSDPFHKNGRGAGGHCLVKDFAAFEALYNGLLPKDLGNDVLKSLSKMNRELLKESGKSLDILKQVYG